MSKREIIATYYSNARELVKRNMPKDARAYIVCILNIALETYNEAKTILLKAKTQAFLDKWIAVSKELYDRGITDYVLKCFGLSAKIEQQLPKPVLPKSHSPKQPLTKYGDLSEVEDKPEYSYFAKDEIDIAGLVEEAAKTQGWCAEVYEKNRTAVVEISFSGKLHGTSGTGFIISNNGYLLTNDHIVYDEQTGNYFPNATMSFADNKKRYKIKVLFSDKKSDVALCSFDPNEIQGFSTVKRIGDYSQILQGADCLVIGNAFDMGLAPFAGVVRFVKNDNGDLVYTAPSNPGDSGGPVFNRQGECIGINKSKTVSVNGEFSDGYTNATPMDEIDKLLFKWTNGNNIIL